MQSMFFSRLFATFVDLCAVFLFVLLLRILAAVFGVGDWQSFGSLTLLGSASSTGALQYLLLFLYRCVWDFRGKDTVGRQMYDLTVSYKLSHLPRPVAIFLRNFWMLLLFLLWAVSTFLIHNGVSNDDAGGVVFILMVSMFFSSTRRHLFDYFAGARILRREPSSV